jgi:hypothetical protein
VFQDHGIKAAQPGEFCEPCVRDRGAQGAKRIHFSPSVLPP